MNIAWGSGHHLSKLLQKSLKNQTHQPQENKDDQQCSMATMLRDFID